MTDICKLKNLSRHEFVSTGTVRSEDPQFKLLWYVRNSINSTIKSFKLENGWFFLMIKLSSNIQTLINIDFKYPGCIRASFSH